MTAEGDQLRALAQQFENVQYHLASTMEQRDAAELERDRAREDYEAAMTTVRSQQVEVGRLTDALAACEASNEEPPPRPPGPTYEDIRMTWVIRQTSSPATTNPATTPQQGVQYTQNARGAILQACGFEGVRGFSHRLPRSAVAPAPGVFDPIALDAGKRIADEAGVAYSPRIMDGRWMPINQMGATVVDSGSTVPAPLNNPEYMEHMESYAIQYLNWCWANGVKLVHWPWHASQWAEIAMGAPIRALPGYSLQSFAAACNAIVSVVDRLNAGRMIMEFPGTGHGPAFDVAPLIATHMKTLTATKWVMQFNGWDHAFNGRCFGGSQQVENTWRGMRTNGALRDAENFRIGFQDIGTGVAPTVDWSIAATYAANYGALYGEIYDQGRFSDNAGKGEVGLDAAVRTMFQ